MALRPPAFCLDRRRCMSLLGGLAASVGPGLQARAQLQLALRFAPVDWAAAESLFALGVPPIAMPEISIFRQWMPEVQIAGEVIDLGARVEPNLELLASLKPERIFLSNWQRSLVPLCERIAPTEIVTIVDARRKAYENARGVLARLAKAVGHPTAAEVYLRTFDEALASYTLALQPYSESPVYIGVLHEGGSQIFVYGEGSWVHDVIGILGFHNALKRPTSIFGNAFIDLAALAESPDATVFYLDQGERTRRAERRLRGSNLWLNLPMVKAGRVRQIPPFYPLGGIPSIWRFARLFSEEWMQRPNRFDD